VTEHSLDRNQTIKGAVALLRCLILFTTPLPREIGALIIAALSAGQPQDHQPHDDRGVDWPLCCWSRVCSRSPASSTTAGCAAEGLGFLDDHGLLPNNLALLLPFSLVTSNAIGSVPSAMLLLQIWPTRRRRACIRWRCCRPWPATCCSAAA
jgi:hypothetical protein